MGQTAGDTITAQNETSSASHNITEARLITTADGNSSDWEYTAHFHDRDYTFDFNPAHNDKINGFVQFVKAMVAWSIVILFEWWLWTEFRNMYVTFTTFIPAKGNTVMGSGGQGTSLIVAIVVTGILVTVPVLFWAAADAGMTWAAGLGDTNPMDDGGWIKAVNMGIYLAKYAFPVGTVISATLNAFIIRKYGISLVMIINRIIAYIVV